MEKAKATIKTAFDATSRIVKNAEQFVVSVALLDIVWYTIWSISKNGEAVLAPITRWIVICSAVIVGLIAAYRFVKFFNK